MRRQSEACIMVSLMRIEDHFTKSIQSSPLKRFFINDDPLINKAAKVINEEAFARVYNSQL